MKADINSIVIYAVALLTSFILLWFAEKLHLKRKLGIVISLIIVALPLAILAGCRYGIGTDYFSYLQKFKYVQSYSWGECFFQHETEILFALIIKVAYAIGKSYEFVFFFIELLTLTIGLLALNRMKNKINVKVGFFIFYLFTYHQSFNVIRQTLAMSVILLGLTFLIERNYKKYIVCVITAMFVHTTAVICILFMLVPMLLREKADKILNDKIAQSNLKLKLGMYYLLVLSSPIIVGQLLQIVISIGGFSSYLKYMNEDVNIGLGTIVIAFFMIIPVYIFGSKYAASKEDEYNILKDILLLYLPISFVGYYASWASRLNNYPQMALIILIPMLFEKNNMRKTYGLKIYYIGYLSFSFVYELWIMNYNQTFPYIFLK